MNKLSRREQEIAKRVRSARENMNPKLTQEEVGDKLGLSQVGYSHYEAFRVPFTVEQLFKLSPILGRSVQYLLGLERDFTDEEDELLTWFEQIETPEFRQRVLNAVKDQAEGDRQFRERFAAQARAREVRT